MQWSFSSSSILSLACLVVAFLLLLGSPAQGIEVCACGNTTETCRSVALGACTPVTFGWGQSNWSSVLVQTLDGATRNYSARAYTDANCTTPAAGHPSSSTFVGACSEYGCRPDRPGLVVRCEHDESGSDWEDSIEAAIPIIIGVCVGVCCLCCCCAILFTILRSKCPELRPCLDGISSCMLCVDSCIDKTFPDPPKCTFCGVYGHEAGRSCPKEYPPWNGGMRCDEWRAPL